MWAGKTLEALEAGGKRINTIRVLTGAPKKLHEFLKDPKKGGRRIRSVWIGGQGDGQQALRLSVEWLEQILQVGGLGGDWEAIGYRKLNIGN